MSILFQYNVNTNRLDSSEMNDEECFTIDEWRKNMQNQLHRLKSKEE